jgi:hypothetical protein
MTIRHYTRKYTHHTKYHTKLKQNTAHKATQTIKDTLHTLNKTKKKGKAIPVTGRGDLWVNNNDDLAIIIIIIIIIIIERVL